ncbi:fibrillin-1-like isoform X2 [Glandiceps talaboti]
MGCNRSHDRLYQQWLVHVFVGLVLSSIVFGQPSNRFEPYSSNNQPFSVLNGANVCGSRIYSYCCPGWRLHPQLNKCIVPICTGNCGGGYCIRPNTCSCNGGQTGPSCRGSQTSDVCNPGCLNGGWCVGPQRCSCPYGFTGRTCERDYRTGPCYTVVQDNRCKAPQDGLVCTKALCCATLGRAWGRPCEQCPGKPHPCRWGFLPSTTSSDCVDVNECETLPNLCDNGECINEIGGYSCSCPFGYTLSEDGTRCDEEEPGEVRGYCYLTSNGPAQCASPSKVKTTLSLCCCDVKGKGWGDGTCRICPENGSVEYAEICARGAVTEPADDLKFCELFERLCDENGECINLPRSYRCECNTGYRLDFTGRCIRDVCGPGYVMDRRGECQDMDECEMDNICTNGDCTNSEGSFYCICSPGFLLTRDGRTCEESRKENCYTIVDNHCQMPSPMLVTKSTCCCSMVAMDVDMGWGNPCGRCAAKNSLEFEQLCKNGMGKDSDEKNINECMLGSNICENGVCEDLNGNYKCRCHPGYAVVSSGKYCQDIDECRNNPNLCMHGTCNNIPGSYQCICDTGYQMTPDSKHCIDRIECESSGMCRNGRCVPSNGEFRCECYQGYRETRFGCEDINECENSRFLCGAGTCMNTIGDYTCSCPEGHMMMDMYDGKNCMDLRQSICYGRFQNATQFGPEICENALPFNLTEKTCCCSVGMAWNNPCEPCPARFSLAHNEICGKKPIEIIPESDESMDLNECIEVPGLCENGICTNTKGGFRCDCNIGFRYSPVSLICEDLNECIEVRGLCENGFCTNTKGGFRCDCNIGFRYSPVSLICEDIDECAEGMAMCFSKATCVNKPGSYDCACPDGYMLTPDKRSCVEY